MEQIEQRTLPGSIPQRRYGRSEDWLSIIGFGGILVSKISQDLANRRVAEAVERGVNYFDVAPSYHDAQDRLGPALEPYRKGVFLACKTTCRDAASARTEFEGSLKALRTDYFDLYQLHALMDVQEDVEAAFAPGGVMEVLQQARKDGQIRHLGFSAHSERAALAAMYRFDFDSVLFPVNFAAIEFANFGPRVIEAARGRNMAVLALKAMAQGRWRDGDPRREQHPAIWYEPMVDERGRELALRYTLALPVTAAIPPGDVQFWDSALATAQNARPLGDAERRELLRFKPEGNVIFSER